MLTLGMIISGIVFLLVVVMACLKVASDEDDRDGQP
jgi:hypothetical protein